MNDLRNNPKYLKEKQYKNPGPLNSRISLHQQFSTNPVDWQQWVFSHFNIQQDMKVLEIGCGPATLWQHNLQIIPSGLNAYLTDFSFGMVKTASTKNLPMEVFHFINCESQTIPFSDHYFDIVVANHMLYHVPDLELTLQEISRVLKKSGTLFAATNGERHMVEVYDLVKKFIPETKEINPVSRNFNLESGAEKLRQFFPVVDRILYTDSLMITEVQPLVDYIHSFWDMLLSDDNLETCADEIKKILEQKGVFHVQKSTGLFVAKKA